MAIGLKKPTVWLIFYIYLESTSHFGCQYSSEYWTSNFIWESVTHIVGCRGVVHLILCITGLGPAKVEAQKSFLFTENYHFTHID